MKPTKQHILDKALRLFNENGFVNVRLQHIADAAFVSVGHLAYHFKNKEAIIDALYSNLQKELQQILNEYKTAPLFTDINRLWLANYELQEKFSFFYLDTLEIVRNHAAIAKKYEQQTAWQAAQYKMILQFNIARGSLIPVADLQLQTIVWHIHNTIVTYKYQCKIQGIAYNSHQYSVLLWGILTPCFTSMGQYEYSQLEEINLPLT
jgi:AcrR family transcriptional regulator